MKPRYLALYLLLALAFLAGGAIAVIETNPALFGLPVPIFDFNATHWLSLVTVLAAVTGWVTSSLISLHNARRQHTINVLLQSRLSQAYQQRLRDIANTYPTINKLKLVKDGDWKKPKKAEALEGVKYLLNYFEFVAVGIRQGELDERTLRMSLQGIVMTLTTMAAVYIKYARGELRDNDGRSSKHAYEHLLWLKDRWSKPPLATRLRRALSAPRRRKR